MAFNRGRKGEDPSGKSSSLLFSFSSCGIPLSARANRGEKKKQQQTGTRLAVPRIFRAAAREKMPSEQLEEGQL